MAYRRFYFEGPIERIDGDLFHHVRDVCRFGIGDRFELLPGDGRAVLVEITAMGKRELAAAAVGERVLPRPPKPDLILALSVPKLPRFDWIAEKCVELGVTEIRPFVSDHSFLRETREISPNRVQRWEKLVRAATQQSGRGDLMRIATVERLGDVLATYKSTPAAVGLFPYEGEARLGLHPAIAAVKANRPREIWAFVGSEGGFSSAEVKVFATFGLEPVSLGEQILRVETACLALVSIIKYETRGLA